jgi:hypothetical protein
MLNTKEIAERLYQTSLLGVEWAVFSPSARLLFDDDGVRLILNVHRIHCAIFRQSLQRPTAPSLGPHCHVHYVGISQDTGFLEKYLSDKNLLPSHIVPYDAAGRTPSDTAFQKLCHLSIVCSSGHLDFIADVVELETVGEQ